RTRHRKLNKLIRSRNQREEIGILNCELLLIDAVQAFRSHRQVLTHALVKNAVAAANDCFCLLAAGRPRKADARSKVEVAVDIALVLVTHSQTEREVWPDLPVVLEITAKVPLADSAFRISGRQAKLARATTEKPNLRAAQALSEENLCATITLDAGDDLGVAERLIVRVQDWTKAATEERISAAEILRRELRRVNSTQTNTSLQGVVAHCE